VRCRTLHPQLPDGTHAVRFKCSVAHRHFGREGTMWLASCSATSTMACQKSRRRHNRSHDRRRSGLAEQSRS
jgi:hypothetical protein